MLWLGVRTRHIRLRVKVGVRPETRKHQAYLLSVNKCNEPAAVVVVVVVVLVVVVVVLVVVVVVLVRAFVAVLVVVVPACMIIHSVPTRINDYFADKK